jgi:nucleoside-diphosphate-sugar epimerase
VAKKRLLIVGCGDVARRALPRWLAHYEVAALVRSPDPALAVSGLRLCIGDLDRPQTLAALAGAADLIVHTAPPPDSGAQDTRTRNLLASLTRTPDGAAMLPQRLVYISTSGVYGDCGGAQVDESHPVNPQTARARRRVDAEDVLARWCGEHGVALVVLRAPGIYAADRLPLAHLTRGVPVLAPEDDVYTNHIHADDLATMLAAGLSAGAGAYNASDDSEMKMGDYFDLVADRMGLPRLPRVRRAEAAARIPPGLLSFMGESRRLLNGRVKAELGIRLRYPTVYEGVPRAGAVHHA